MRVNVSKAFISKTFMYGLKVSLQRQLTKSNKKKSLEFYLNLDKTIKQKQKLKVSPLYEALTLLTEFATFASLLQPLLLAVVVLINIFISFNGFSRLTVLMNDFRLKTFYCKSSKSSKSNKTIKKSTTKLVSKTFSTTLTSAATIKLKLSATSIKLSTLPTTINSSSFTDTSAAAAFATSATLLKAKSSKNNNHNRTYNNSSKSNKVFLYYTPRDPRLRILIKTKHFSKRPQQQPQVYNNNCCCDNKSSFKVLSDLCNYGELIGGQYNSGVNKTIVKQLNNNNINSKANLNKTKEICDNLIKTSDNLIVATAARAAIETSSADVLIVILTVVAVISEYTKELFKSIEILL
ncbi:uncharacterized protein LOC119614192, partial [Lucilia sericata]|uniref:uncharacterized protein LOC119614192 n=1 Tax=Lucilia sericata TaxID=13632 RepID=UPI0018A8642E